MVTPDNLQQCLATMCLDFSECDKYKHEQKIQGLDSIIELHELHGRKAVKQHSA